MLITCRITNDKDEMIRRAKMLKFINYINIKKGALSDISVTQNTYFIFIDETIIEIEQFATFNFFRNLTFNRSRRNVVIKTN